MTLASIWGLLKFYGTEIGTAVGAVVTVYGWWKLVWSRKKRRDRVATLVAVGDRIAQSADLEGQGYEKAIEQYEKALALDEGSVGIFRKILAATRSRLELENPVTIPERRCQEEIQAALTRIYEFQATHPELKEDRALLLEEATLLQLAGKYDSARAVLQRAHGAAPEDAEVLARLGLATRDAGLIRRALEKQPANAWYHDYLGYVLQKEGRHADAIREYRRTAELADRSTLRSSRLHYEALNEILSVFRQGDVLRAELGMPLEERAEMLEYFFSKSGNKSAEPHFLMATLNHALRRFEAARASILKVLGDHKPWWRERLQALRLYARILEDGGLDPAALAEVRAILAAEEERKQYEERMEAARDEKGHRYKVGLRVGKTPGDGVPVLRSFEGYPFARAGVREGDRILEFAHRKIRNLSEICLRLVEFTPGTDVPLKVQRGSDLLDLTLIIQ